MEAIESIVAEIVGEREDLFLLEVKVSGHSGAQKIVVLIDGDKGIGVDDCSKISRRLGAILEEKDIFNGKYTLEVSSPGIDTPLINPRQYQKNIGRKMKVNVGGQEHIGALKQVNTTSIVVLAENKINKKIEIKEVEIPFETIDKAKVLVSF